MIHSGATRPILLDSTGPILTSALFDIPCEQGTATLRPGDSLLLYTDGVTEAQGPGGMFGQERLVRAILGGRRGADLLDALLAEVVAFSNSPSNQDDITLLTLDLAEPATANDGASAV
jgi:phosphoserine phosphatase RsbU/P